MKTLTTHWFPFLFALLFVIDTAIAQENAANNSYSRNTCVDCTPGEQVFADMAYLNQLLDVLQSYQSRIARLDPKSLEYLRVYLKNTGANNTLIEPFLTNPIPQEEPESATGQIQTTATTSLVSLLPDQTPPPYVPPPPSGIDGLVVAFAQESNSEVGRTASATIVSHKVPKSYFIGDSFVHNNTTYTLNNISRGVDPTTGNNWLYVSIKNEAGKTVRIPWDHQ